MTRTQTSSQTQPLLRTGLMLVSLSFVIGVPAKTSVATICCPRCSCSSCKLNVEKGEEEKSCWNIECEEICVPRVVFPWQNHKWFRRGDGHLGECAGSCDTCDGAGCPNCCIKHNGAFVVKVKKLKKHKYTCPKCEYEWEVDGDGSCCGGKGCDNGGTCPRGECCQIPGQPTNLPTLTNELNYGPSVPINQDAPAPQFRQASLPEAQTQQSMPPSAPETTPKWRLPFFDMWYR